MRKLTSITVLAALTLGLAACGGSDNNAFVAPTSPTGGATVSTIAVTTSAATIPADGSATSTITAHATDANNTAVSGTPITFSSSAGTISGSPATTDAMGNATATLTAGSAAAGASIIVTASAGSASGKVTVTVSNTQQTITVETSAPQIPSDDSKPVTITALVRDSSNNFVPGATVHFTSTSGGITVTQATTDTNGTATATLNTAGDQTNRTITVTATVGKTSATVPVDVVGTKLTLTGVSNIEQGSTGSFTLALTDSSGNGIPSTPVTLTSSISGNTLTPTSVTTDATGHATFTLTATSAGNGSQTVTAGALGLTASQTVVISNQKFVFVTPAPNTQVDLNVGLHVTVNWTVGGVPQVNKAIAFSVTRGTVSAGTVNTDASGNASVTVMSTTAGPATVSATATGVSSQLNVDFLATMAATVVVQASPATIATQGQSTITAVVRDAQNNLVEGQTVNFTLPNDITGGSLSPASAVTDVQGRAQSVYTATTTTSSKNGVEVDATVQGTAVTGKTDLTVGGQTVFLSLGTGNTIIALNASQYDLPYAVQAIDAAGNALDGANVTLVVTSVAYYKGTQVFGSTFWSATSSITAGPDPCPSEDANNNGILDPGEDGQPADAGLPTFNPFGNRNGKLDPGLVASVKPASLTTANGGTGLLDVIYPKDHAEWVTVTLTASAVVQGTQASTSATFVLPGLSTDYNNQSVAPPGPVSPYGQGATCTDPN